jgi:hypothetical protein
MTTLFPRRTQSTVVERILDWFLAEVTAGFNDMRTIPYYTRKVE